MSASNTVPIAAKSVHPGNRFAQPSFEHALRGGRARVETLLPSFLSLTGVFLCTWISFRAGLGFSPAGFLYLVFVVLAAVYGGFWQATVVSVVSVACLDYF